MSREADVYLVQIRNMSRTLDQVIDSVSADMFNRRPGPHLNPVGWNYFHVLRIWDLDLNWMCKGQKPDEDAWHRGGFTGKAGYNPDGKGIRGLGLGFGYSDDEVDEVQVDVSVLKAYQQMLLNESEAYLADADEAALSRETPSLLNPDLMRTNSERFQHTIAHTHEHVGEIRYAMGMLGWRDPSYPGRETGSSRGD